MAVVAVFGEKDWQQLAVVRRMAADLGLPVDVVSLPTVRAGDGLALSSRNALLGAEERVAAVALSRSLTMEAAGLARGEEVGAVLNQAIRTIKQAGFGPVDYLTYVDGSTLEPLEQARAGGRLIAAAFLGKIRLIDNIRVILDTEVD